MTDLVIVLLLIVLNGVFAMSEIAIVSANRIRLQQRAEGGDGAARRALELAAAPNRFLSTVQIGITLIGVVAGAFGGARLARPLAETLERVPWLAAWADPLAFGLVVVAITYLSLVLGELAPKRIGLNDPERVAALSAGPMDALSRLATPLVGFLSLSTNAVLWLLRVRPRGEPAVSEEEIEVLVEQGRRAGVVEAAEQAIIENAFWLGERNARDLMTPRPDVAWLDLDDLEAEAVEAGGAEAPSPAGERVLAELLSERPFSRYLLARGEIDEVVGVVHTRDLLMQRIGGGPIDPASVSRKALFVPETLPTFDLLERFRDEGTHFAVVLDEYGGVEGVVTLTDVLEELIGEIANQEPADAPQALQRRDGSLLADGLLPVERLEALLELPEGTLEQEGVDTLGGFVTARLGRIPDVGESFEAADYRFTVAAMAGRRVARVRIGRKAEGRSA